MNPKQLQALRRAMEVLTAINTFWDEGTGAMLSPSAWITDAEEDIRTAVADAINQVEISFPKVMQ